MAVMLLRNKKVRTGEGLCFEPNVSFFWRIMNEGNGAGLLSQKARSRELRKDVLKEVSK
jgi:hypothetical protein